MASSEGSEQGVETERDPLRPSAADPRAPAEGASLPPLAGEEGAEEDEAEPRFFEDPKKILQTLVIVGLLVAAIYLLLPQIVGIDDAVEKLGRANMWWIAVAFVFGILMFVAYVGLFRGVVGERIQLTWGESYEITMAGLAATRLFSAGGAGGIVLTYWALRRAGMPRKESAGRMVAFLVLLYAVYMLTLVIDGILLRVGVFPGAAPAGLTIVPAAIAGGVILLFLLAALIPGDLEKRFSQASQETLIGRVARRLATVPSTVAVGVRDALAFVREPNGGLAIAGAIGFWAANIAILWASFQAFDVHVPLAVVVQGFFVGMIGNLLPLPGGVGGVDAGMIGAFVLFGFEGGTVIAAVLIYRLIAFWLPLPPGIVAFFQLRATVARWKEEQRGRAIGAGDSPTSASGAGDSPTSASGPGPTPVTSKSEV